MEMLIIVKVEQLIFSVKNGVQCYSNTDCLVEGATGTPATCSGIWESPGCDLDCVQEHNLYIDLSSDIAADPGFDIDNTTAVVTNLHYPVNAGVYVSTTFDLIILQGCMDGPGGYEACTCQTCAHACGYCDDGVSTSYFECSVQNTGTWTSYCTSPYSTHSSRQLGSSP